MGVNGEALHLCEVYKKPYFFTASHVRIHIFTMGHARIHFRYCKSCHYVTLVPRPHGSQLATRWTSGSTSHGIERYSRGWRPLLESSSLGMRASHYMYVWTLGWLCNKIIITIVPNYTGKISLICSRWYCHLCWTLITTQMGNKFVIFSGIALCYGDNLVSQATPFAAQRKGLVKLQPSSCCHRRNLMWPIRSALFVDCIRCHEVAITSQRVQHFIIYLLLIIVFLGDNSTVAAWPDPSSALQRVYIYYVACKLHM